jgi:hypothetical protein
MALTVGARGEVYTQDKAERRDEQVCLGSVWVVFGPAWLMCGC